MMIGAMPADGGLQQAAGHGHAAGHGRAAGAAVAASSATAAVGAAAGDADEKPEQPERSARAGVMERFFDDLPYGHARLPVLWARAHY